VSERRYPGGAEGKFVRSIFARFFCAGTASLTTACAVVWIVGILKSAAEMTGMDKFMIFLAVAVAVATGLVAIMPNVISAKAAQPPSPPNAGSHYQPPSGTIGQ
jgi:hypothetical protein